MIATFNQANPKVSLDLSYFILPTGIESILIMDDGCLIVGSGDGTIDLLDEINWKGEFPKGKIVNPSKPYFKAVNFYLRFLQVFFFFFNGLSVQ